MSLLKCAVWLRGEINHWTGGDPSVDTASAVARVEEWLVTLQAYASAAPSNACLPAKDALQLQVSGQECWNATFLLKWSADRRELKHKTRRLSALLFLAGHHTFASSGVFKAHVAHHLEEAERCVLMCLKVSKTLAQQEQNTTAARAMLAWAAQIIDACRDVPAAQLRQHTLELRFAQLHVLWAAGEFAGACATAEKLAMETEDSPSYREALHEFIHNTALSTQCSDTEIMGSSCFGPTTQRGDGAPESARCVAVQRLLSLSLQVQMATKVRTLKQQSALGMTELLLSCAYMQTGSFEAAAAAATSAYDRLHTFEPLVVLLKASTHLQRNAEVVRVFALLSRCEEVSVTELCALATCAVAGCASVQAEAGALLRQRLSAQPPNEEEDLRFLCFLVHMCSEWSMRELLDAVGCRPPRDGATRRFLFCSLWRAAAAGGSDGADTADEEQVVLSSAGQPSSGISTETRWQCLRVALRDFAADSSSPVEREGALLDLTRLAVLLHPADSVPAEESWKMWQACQTEGIALGVPCHVARAQLAFLLGRRDDGVASVAAICHSSDAALVGQACGTLIHFLLTRSEHVLAGTVAQLCLPHLSGESSRCLLEFGKVCALGFLASDNAALQAELTSLLVQYVCPVLSAVEADAEQQPSAWWCDFLWYLSDRVLDTSPAAAVRLSHTAVCLHLELQAAVGASSAAFPVATARERMLALLETEFDLFVGGLAELSEAELRRCVAKVSDAGAGFSSEENALPHTEAAAAGDRWRVTLQLSRIELHLRELQHRTLAEVAAAMDAGLLASLMSLPDVTPADLEQVARVCCRVSNHFTEVCVPLRGMAVKLCVSAADAHHGALLEAPFPPRAAATLPLLYDAYGMAPDEESRTVVFESLMRVVEATGCGDLRCAAAEQEDEDSISGAAATQTLVETMVEFFAVEAWNACVQWNALQHRDRVAVWRAWALALVDRLDETNAARVAIGDLSTQMPLL